MQERRISQFLIVLAFIFLVIAVVMILHDDSILREELMKCKTLNSV